MVKMQAILFMHEGADFGSLTLAYYSVVTFLFALILPFIADKLGRKLTHSSMSCYVEALD